MRLASVFVGAAAVAAVDLTQLEGTWTTKSNAVFTGPDFYDPVDELLIEPALPGLSYSFTSDGFYEEAVYQVSANPKDPSCPSAVLIFQHGTYTAKDDGIVLTPFEVDGRQLLSEPCNSDNAVYSRYNQSETYKTFAVYTDNYYGRLRLDLFKFDGSPMPPMYIAYKPPMMLPTITMNPTSAPTASNTVQKIRRRLENRGKTNAVHHGSLDYNTIWWLGVSMVGVGATGWLLF